MSVVEHVYRASHRLYPRSFREEYGADMALLLAEQLRAENRVRVVTRAFIDLAISVPSLHLEAHMNRLPNATVPVLFGGISLSSAILALVAGSEPRTALIALAIAIATGVFAVASWRRNRVLGVGVTTASWWRFLSLGLVAFIGLVVALNVSGEVSSGMWLPMIVALFGSIAVMITGLALGVTHLIRRRARPAV
jgi:hypothetical protein